MITRTFFVTKVNALVADTEKQNIEVKGFELFKKFKSQDKIVKELRRKFDTDTLRILSIDKVIVEEVLIGMENDRFIEYGHRMETRKKRK